MCGKASERNRAHIYDWINFILLSRIDGGGGGSHSIYWRKFKRFDDCLACIGLLAADWQFCVYARERHWRHMLFALQINLQTAIKVRATYRVSRTPNGTQII